MAGCRIDGLTGPQPTAADRAPQEQSLPVLSSLGGDGAESAAAVPVGAPPPPREEPATETRLEIGPDRVLDLDGRAVEALLGEPDFVRRENPMELWRYRHERCAVALFLYAEEADGRGALRVRHVEAWAPGEEQTSPRACLSAIANRAGPISDG
ncbi:MAG: hypothetical protein OXI64_03245 [Defluviicoccus sp.]|nr:hypothetical protein [Defluviicoccus sp.]